MKKMILCFILILLQAQWLYGIDKDAADKLMSNNTLGTDFLIAIPPNENEDELLLGEVFEIYVTSNEDTEVRLEAFGMPPVTKPVKKSEITTFSSLNGDLPENPEIRNYTGVDFNSIRITSEDSISVYVINKKDQSCDGFVALPVSSWGKEYIHVGYYDESERNRKGGFMVLVSEDNTSCTISLRGKGSGKTMGGNSLGDDIVLPLNAGHIFTVSGMGLSNDFDLTGTSIKADKPIGLISFHERAKIPEGVRGGHDHLSEMIPPVSTWGVNYTTVEFYRKGKGDFFRLVAAYDNTSFSVKYYDLQSKQMIDEMDGTLENAGDFFEYNRDATEPRLSIRGTAVWKANKPVLLMQYSYSTKWDDAPIYDPFMIVVTSNEQFIQKTVFQTPAEAAGFDSNYLNLIIKNDRNVPDLQRLRTLKIDGELLYQKYPTLLENNIPGTDLYWVRLDLEEGAHTVESDAYFGGYVYGFDEYNSYGWPAAIGTRDITFIDTVAPEVDYVYDCGNYTGTATEYTDGSSQDKMRQKDTGLESIELLPDSYNYEIEFITDDQISIDPPVYEFVFRLHLKDAMQPAAAFLKISDQSGNTKYDTLRYDPAQRAAVSLYFKFKDLPPEIVPGLEAEGELVITSEDWSVTPADSISIQYSFKDLWFIPKNDFELSDELKIMNWNLSRAEKIENGRKIIEINMTGGDPLTEDLILGSAKLVVMTTNDRMYAVGLEDAELGIDPGCYRISEIEGDTLYPDYCGIGFREIESINRAVLKSVYPNPADGGNIKITFESGKNAYASATIYDIYGNITAVVKSREYPPGVNEININCSTFPSGTYFLKFSDGLRQSTEKIIILK